ncbi:ABC transporter substrate-binding protein, partial [Pseudomonas sp. BGM005]|nr:ABC transporter substrate-binding protein [Pseudomonas sp. BG5]
MTGRLPALLLSPLVAGAIAATCVEQAAAKDTVAIEKRSLEELHKAALAEGGRLIVYAGGDTAGQQDGMKKAFEERFPGMTLDIVVDYSKFHDARIDNQIATGTLVPD